MPSRNGRPSTTNALTMMMAIGTARAITLLVVRYQKLSVTSFATGSGLPRTLRSRRRTSRASIRSPSRVTTAGTMTSAAMAPTKTTATPAYPNDLRKYIGNRISATRASATVSAENSTVRPAVVMVRTSASSRGLPAFTSSR
ncbi:Uncharacterised protein [Mycobacteroides abscessus subsp. abscessus]|nr:Uncharacterised protein [Mycobacteroides abscessus subsp. abscessus]